jgi:hypothetical protein
LKEEREAANNHHPIRVCSTDSCYDILLSQHKQTHFAGSTSIIMFAPVAFFHHDDEEEEDAFDHGEEEVVRVEVPAVVAAAAPVPMPLRLVIKVKNCVLVLGIGVATFIQFCTLEPRYLNTLMWGRTRRIFTSFPSGQPQQ